MLGPLHHRIAILTVRVALAAAFLSAVADRFGIWGPPGTVNVAWGEFSSFVAFTGMLLPFLPASVIPFFAWSATILEVVIAIGLLAGRYVRWFAMASALLLLTFAVSMTYSLGVESAFSYSVWTAAAASYLLATTDSSKVVANEKRNDE